jgi:hypothetical protein
MYKVESEQSVRNPTVTGNAKLVEEIRQRHQMPLPEVNSLPHYTNFNDVTLQQLVELICFQDKEGFTPVIEEYTTKLFRFCEINLWQYHKKLRSKQLGTVNKLLFHQLLISFLINSYSLTNDFRYLNTALKLNDVLKSSLFSRLGLSLNNRAVLRLSKYNDEFLNQTTAI